MIAGLGDELGCLGSLGFRFGAGGFRAGEGGRHVEGEAGALQREVREVEPHLLAGDVLHLGEVDTDAVDKVRVAGRGAVATMRRAGEQGFGNAVGTTGLAEAGDGGVERGGGLRVAERVLRSADQQVAEADVEEAQALAEIVSCSLQLRRAAREGAWSRRPTRV